jgi:hypothetical protein
MLLHINGKFTMGKLKSSLMSYSFVLDLLSLSMLRCRSRHKVELSVFVISFILSQWDRCSGGFTIVLKHRTPLAMGGPSSCQQTKFDGFLLVLYNFTFEGVLFRMSDCLCRPSGFNSFRAQVRDLIA